MATTWIITADSSRAKILQVMDREHHLEQVEDFVNPQARMHERDLSADAESQGAIEHGIGTFAKTLGDYLEKARLAHRYDRLQVIAPPKVLGVLRKELNKQVQKLVFEELPKDLASLSARELEGRLFGDPRGDAR